MSFIFKIFLLIILFVKPLSANISEDLLKLSDMYSDGLLTSEEFTKAKSILLKIKEIKSEKISKDQKRKETITKKKKISSSDVKIEKIFGSVGSKFTNKSFEKMKLTVGDFVIYTHRPGAVKIKKISNNKQYAVIGDKLNVKFYNGGQDLLDIKVNKKNNELILKINNSKILVWKGQYIQIANATFYQILAMGRLPFHFYIKLDVANNAAAINMEKFNRSIELAIIVAKEKLSEQYNISISQIDEIIKQNDLMAVYGQDIPTNKIYNSDDQKKLTLYADLKNSIGDDNFKILRSDVDTALNRDLKDTVNKQVQIAIDETIRDAINSGIEAAALEAGIAALIDALMSGASWADALDAGKNACGC